jgi:hypothetical protein
VATMVCCELEGCARLAAIALQPLGPRAHTSCCWVYLLTALKADDGRW